MAVGSRIANVGPCQVAHPTVAAGAATLPQRWCNGLPIAGRDESPRRGSNMGQKGAGNKGRQESILSLDVRLVALPLCSVCVFPAARSSKPARLLLDVSHNSNSCTPNQLTMPVLSSIHDVNASCIVCIVHHPPRSRQLAWVFSAAFVPRNRAPFCANGRGPVPPSARPSSGRSVSALRRPVRVCPTFDGLC